MNRKKELEEANSANEIEQINHKFDEEKLASRVKFLEEMKTAIDELPKPLEKQSLRRWK